MNKSYALPLIDRENKFATIESLTISPWTGIAGSKVYYRSTRGYLSYKVYKIPDHVF